MDFTHLHVHSYYSLMDGLNSPEELAQAAKDVGQSAIAITDHGTLSSHRDLQTAVQNMGIKPILGVEAYFSPTDRFDKREVKKREDNTQLYNHLILLAKDQTGLRNLNRLSELAWTEGFYHKPRMDKEILNAHGDGLIVLSGCLNGLIAKAIERDNDEEARTWLEWFKNRFGDDFYIELQSDNPANINHGLLKYADAYGIKTTATADCHFAREESRAVEELMLILSTNPKPNKEVDYAKTKNLPIFERLNALYPERPISFEKLALFVRSKAQMQEAFEQVGIFRSELYESTQEIVDKIGQYDYPKGLDLLPTPKSDPSQRLRNLVMQGLRKRGKQDDPRYLARIDEEFSVVDPKGFPPYFLVVYDTVTWAKKQGILVGPARGSAAGSLICYALGITDIDPIEFDLLFFRFIDPTRDDFPDIDLDFEDRRRGEVKEYLRRKFKHVASISTFTMFNGKNVVRDVARVFNIPLGEVNKALKGADAPPKVDFLDWYEQTPQGRDFFMRYPEVKKYAKELQGRIKSVGMHAAGMVVAKEPIENYAPIETRKDTDDKVSGRIPVVALDMDTVADIGLIKLDLLGLKTLSVIADTLRQINVRRGIDIELLDLPLNDPGVYRMLSDGHTKGVFQAEAAPYTRLLKHMKVDSFEDLAASNALVRPGAMNTVGDIYIKRKHGEEKVKYIHPIMEQFTANTYGVIIYQEQVMQACHFLGGMSMADANKVRRIIGKKKDVKEFEQYKDAFVTGASEHITKKQAESLWHDFEAHAGYSFNRSHAVGYSLISYWTAWLKLNYPLEFVYALLKNEQNKDTRTEYLIEAKRLNQRIILPHVNKSDLDFTIEGEGIRFGLSNIKYISDNIGTKLMEARPFDTYQDLLDVSETKYSGINSRTIAALNKVGAANMPGNPLRGDESENFYEYLNIPKFATHNFPAHMTELIVPLDLFTEDETFVVRAMVKNIKRGEGWARVEVVDESGTAGIFHNADTLIEPGQLYFILVANNRVSRYVTAEELYEAMEHGTRDAFMRYLIEEHLYATPGFYYVVNFERRLTKAGKMMGYLTLCNEEKEMKTLMVWPKDFSFYYAKIRPGEIIRPQIKAMGDGTLFISGLDA